MAKIIAIVGLCGSGKSVVADYLENHGYYKIYFGGFVLEEIKNRNLEINTENEKYVREDLRKLYGMEAIAALSFPKIIDALKTKKVLIDGMYSYSEYKFLKSKFNDEMITIAVFTPKKLRYSRLSKRKIRPLSIEEAKNRDTAEIENIEKGQPIALADYTIVNDSNQENLINKLTEIIRELD